MSEVWYVSRDGQTFGPFSFDRLAEAARSGDLRKDDLTWQPEMKSWQPAADLPDLWAQPAVTTQPLPSVAPSPLVAASTGQHKESEHTSDLKRAAESEAANRETQKQQKLDDSRSRNFIVRHWRGELSLPVAYWLVGTLLTVALALLGEGVGTVIANLDFSPTMQGVWLTAFLILVCLSAVWQLVGIWRSAGQHIVKTKRRRWAIAARVMVVLGFLRAAVDFSTIVGPMLTASLELASGTSDIPAHEFRLLREGRELELSGGMPYGTAEALEKFLNAAPSVKVVHLNSLGGLISEGIQINKLIAARNLITYTSADCSSACTIAFLGGAQRYLSQHGKLGFHSASFGTLDQKILPELNREMRTLLMSSGVPLEFVDKALATDAALIWHPTTTELINANIVTAVIDPSNFAISGIKDWRSPTATDEALTQIPYTRALKKNNPVAFAKMVSKLDEGLKAGKSSNELMNEIHGLVSRDIIPVYLKIAPDKALVRYWRSQVAEMRYLSTSSPSNCIAFLGLTERPPDFNLTKLVPQALIDEDLAALTYLFEATILSDLVPRASSPDVQNSIVALIASLERAKPGVSSMVLEPEKHTTNPRSVCEAFVGFYDEIFALPLDQSASVLKALSTLPN